MDEHLLEVYLINTARHTEETPVAEWVSLPTDAETMKAVFERLGVDGSDTEQYQVSAYQSSLDGWSEALQPGESLDDLNYLAALLTQRSDEERDKFAAAVLCGDHAASAADLINLTHNLDCYCLYPTVHNSEDYGHYVVDELDELELPDAAKRFFDYKSYGREAVKEDRGIFTDYGYVYNNGNDYAEWYKANQVPQEYRLTAQPSPQRDMDELPQGAALPTEPIPVRPLVLNATDTQGRIKEITEHLEQGVQEVFESERYRDYLKAMSRFHNYSLNNTLLIVMQKPDASLVAGYGKWRDEFERHVKSGEKGIKILAPAPYKVKQKTEKLDEQELFEFSRKIRIYYALSCLTKQDKYLDLCLDTIRNAILVGAVAGLSYDPTAKMEQEEVVVRLPVRVNWGGGWSDTPPYCMEHGGTVLNAAVKLDGQNPVEAVVKKIPGNQIVLASADSGAEQAFSEISQLQDSSNPYDPFALHKAALIACGIIPYREQISVEEVTKNLGSGLYLSTQVIHIPRGSGLGTSSILAGACVKAIYRMLGKELSQEELYNRVLCMEQIMSTGGGWQDQVGGLAPGIKMVTSDAAIVQEIGCSPCSISTETLQELNERFCLIYSGQRRLARNLLRDIVSRYVSGNPDTVEVLYEIQRIAVLMRFELEKGNVDGFAQLLNQHWELSKRLDGGCTNTCIDMIFSSVEDLIDGKMICGAGGGGFLQVILKKGVTAEQVQKRLREVFQDSGVEVWRCSLV